MQRDIRRVIITGGTGVVGYALIRMLIQNNIEVLVLCRENSRRNDTIPKDPLVETRICPMDELKNIQNHMEKSYDIFFHMAWEGTVGEDRNNVNLQMENISYCLDAIEAAKRFGCRRFIGLGSQAEYGRVNQRLTTSTPTIPDTGYGIAKLCAGMFSRIKAKELKIDHIWVRILSVYGPNDGDSMVMSTIRDLLNGKAPQFTKGEQQWDYLFSFDAAKALLMLGEKGVSEKTYVLGSGKVYPLKDYVCTINKIANGKSELKFGDIPYSSNQVMYLCADIEELQNDTGFVPETSFEDGIQATLNWYLEKGKENEKN